MATFGKMTTQIDPSEAGKAFPVETRVMFTIRNQPQTGVITKQLKNAAVVELDENAKNGDLVNHSNGVVVINYKQMKKIQ